MDSAMVSLIAETKSIRIDIASNQTHVLGLEQRVSTVEAQATSFQDRDQELLFLCSKLTDLEDRSRRDNVRYLGFPENNEGEDIHGFLQETLLALPLIHPWSSKELTGWALGDAARTPALSRT
ncbi:hypothetical protein NDU88_002601 [Pleurodeles waltl]|uniref:Uncharacterized protein n=1 Tax=Pleurodeles waltl TaxID=8319 RepID=A0AAV7VDA8_PLEWA|nr:hypothetical protein NDU88_002601 [Pleurodeles waltl]